MDGFTRKEIAEEQATIETILQRIELITSMVERSDLRALGRQRRELVHTLFHHFSSMELRVYPQLLAICRPDERASLAAMRLEGRELADAYRHHIARWNADNLLADWTPYRLASLALIERMRAHFSRSQRLIHPIVGRLPPQRSEAVRAGEPRRERPSPAILR